MTSWSQPAMRKRLLSSTPGPAGPRPPRRCSVRRAPESRTWSTPGRSKAAARSSMLRSSPSTPSGRNPGCGRRQYRHRHRRRVCSVRPVPGRAPASPRGTGATRRLACSPSRSPLPLRRAARLSLVGAGRRAPRDPRAQAVHRPPAPGSGTGHRPNPAFHRAFAGRRSRFCRPGRRARPGPQTPRHGPARGRAFGPLKDRLHGSATAVMTELSPWGNLGGPLD